MKVATATVAVHTDLNIIYKFDCWFKIIHKSHKLIDFILFNVGGDIKYENIV